MDIPKNKPFSKRALVVEGGGMHGVFTAGVLDAFLDTKFPLFDGYFGVASGAINIVTYLCNRRGTSLDAYTSVVEQTNNSSLRRHSKDEPFSGSDLLCKTIAKSGGLPMALLHKKLQKRQFHIVATTLTTGDAVYHPIDETTSSTELLDILKASSTTSFLDLETVTINDQEMIDGSLSDPIPFQKARAEYYEQVVILRNQPIDFRKKAALKDKLYAWKTRKTPSLNELLKQQDRLYNQTADELSALSQQDDTRVIQVAPEQPLLTSRKKVIRNDLIADYHQGYTQGYKVAEQLLTSIF